MVKTLASFFTLEEITRIMVICQVNKWTLFYSMFSSLMKNSPQAPQIYSNWDTTKERLSSVTSYMLNLFLNIYQNLQTQAVDVLPKEHDELGDLIGIDGSLIDACLSMHWADYRKGSKKAKVHLGFDLNHRIPRKIFLSDGNGAERPFVSMILSPGQTGVMDRGYQAHDRFDQWQEEGKHFVCRIKARTRKKRIKDHEINPDSNIFYDAIVLLGTPGVNQTKKPLRLVGYTVDGTKYWVATSRYDLTAEQIAFIYKLRWDIEKFFAWWKRHLRVYHLIARSEYGLMVQILSGLITYLLLAIYCREQHNEKVSIKRVRELRIKIQNETRIASSSTVSSISENDKISSSYAST